MNKVPLRELRDSCHCPCTKVTFHRCRDAPVRGNSNRGSGSQRRRRRRWDPCRHEDRGETEAAYVCDSEPG